MIVQKIDRIGGAVIGTAADLVEGDFQRITTDSGAVIDQQYHAPVPYVPAKRTCSRDEVIDLLPSGVMKACRDSTNAAVIRAFYKFLAKGGFTYLEGVVLGDGLEAIGIITAQNNIDYKAAWPTA